jgi:hypothetical protein
MVILAQDKQGHTVSSETGALSCTETNHSMVREIVNAVGNVRTLDSVLLEVSKSTDTILRQYQVRKVIKTGDATDANTLPSGNDLSGENSTDSSMFSGHQNKILQAQVDVFEEEIVKKNGIVNRVVEEKSESQTNRRLTEYEGGGSSRK